MFFLSVRELITNTGLKHVDLFTIDVEPMHGVLVSFDFDNV